MVKEYLTSEMIEDGKEVIRKLDDEKLEIRSAL